MGYCIRQNVNWLLLYCITYVSLIPVDGDQIKILIITLFHFQIDK
jgi:hypothetical protein